MSKVAGDHRVDVVHVVAKTHLDLGFTALAGEVEARYIDEFFPRALEVAEDLRQRGGTERLVWTTGSWILHRALHHGTDAQRRRVADGIERGDLTWHALAVTTHTELLNARLLRAALGISAELDERFGRTTTAAKMTDVPGHTRALVSHLAAAGVTFLHLGVNPAWPVPHVPPMFVWRAPDGAEVVVAYQAGGYGGSVALAGCGEVLTFLHSGDNLGPPSVQDVLDHYSELAERYPGAEIHASTLDGFARAITPHVDALEVVTAEIGDPWLFGAGSDPAKVSRYRSALRLLEGTEALGGPERIEVERSLLLVAEHTWGLDQKEALPNTTEWNRSGLGELRQSEACRRFESSWAEQRGYVDRALSTLTGGVESPDGTDLIDCAPHEPGSDHALYGRGRHQQVRSTAVEPSAAVEVGGWRVAVDPVDGALRELVECSTGRVLADAAHPLGLVRYQSFDATDYERFYGGLSPTPEDEWWARWDNTKPGIDTVPQARSGMWSARSARAWYSRTEAPRDGGSENGSGIVHYVQVRLGFDSELHEQLGAPPEAWVDWSWRDNPDDHSIKATVSWADKPANRLPEAMWCSFVPIVTEPERWEMDKIGQWTSPLDVVRRGGRSIHGIGDGGLRHSGPDGDLGLFSLDAPLVAPGRPNLLDADPPLPDLAGGWHVLLLDNCWGTNFSMWIEGPARYRFELTV